MHCDLVVELASECTSGTEGSDYDGTSNGEPVSPAGTEYRREKNQCPALHKPTYQGYVGL